MVVGADCTLDGAVVGVGRVMEAMVVGVGRVVEGPRVGVVGAGAATAAPVPNRSVTQPFGHPIAVQEAHPDADPAVGRVEQDLPVGRRVQELLVELGADITVGAAAGGDNLGQRAAGGEVGIVSELVGPGHLT